jgi:hypothetical protein
MLTLFIIIVLAVLTARGIGNRLDPRRPRVKYYWRFGRRLRDLQDRERSEFTYRRIE